MANSDKNILITPNISAATGVYPSIKFNGANNTPINLNVLDDGTTSFSATSGQLFSISDTMSGSIFSVNDISGVPSIEILDTGLIKLNQYGGSSVFGGSSAIQSGTTNSKISVYTVLAGAPGIIVRGASSQSANLQEWQNSSGTLLSSIKSDGGFYMPNSSTFNPKLQIANFFIDGFGATYTMESVTIGSTSDSSRFASGGLTIINRGGASNVPFGVQGSASQTADLAQWRNSAGTVLASISPTGKLTSAVDASINGVVIGMGAGSASTNTSVGLNSLVSNTTGTYNTAFGNQSLQLNTSGTQNTAFGQNALYNNRTGWYNTAFGQGALQNNNYAYSNTAIGVAAMISNVSGSGNTAVGIASLQSNISGGNNVVIGSNSGFSNSTGSGNIFLGTEAGYYETGSNKLYIANTNTTTPLIGGDFSAKTLTFAGNATITSQATGTVGLIVKAIASQSANLQEWQNSAGTVVASMRGDGLFNSYWGYHTYLQPQSGIGAYINLTNNGIIIAGYTNVADKILVVKGMSGQTGNLQEWQDSAGTVLSVVDSAGRIVLGRGSQLASATFTIQGNTSTYSPDNTSALANRIIFLRGNTGGNLMALTSKGDAAQGVAALVITNGGFSTEITGFGYNGNVYTNLQSATAVGLTIKGAASQTADLQQWQGSDGNALALVNSSGAIITGGIVRATNGGIFGGTSQLSTALTVYAQTSGQVGAIIRGATSQTANLQEWQDSTGAVIAKVDASGYFGSSGVYGTTGKWSLETAYGGGFMALAKTTSAVANPGADTARMYLVAGTNAGTLKLVVRAGASGAETTILDNIPQS